jgi:hypothetical protein
MAGEARQQRLDALGLAISAICLVHCLALPIIALLVPALTFGLGAQTDHAFHWVLLGLAVPISTLALWRGAARHKDTRWLKLGSAGLAIMLIGVLNAFGAESEVPLTMIGVVMLAIAHTKNFARSHRHRLVDG